MGETRPRVQAVLQTDVGRVRRQNQDFVAAREPVDRTAEARDGWLYILADGAGGMDDGELASQYATQRALHHYLESEEPDWLQRLTEALRGANSDLRALGARRNGGSRMATTMVATVIQDGRAYIANVGDSRAYHWRAGALNQITRDQSLVAQLVEEGAITPEEAAVHPRRHVLLHSIGSDRTPKIDLYQVPLQPDDLLLICSDGLLRHVEDAEISAKLASQPQLDQAVRELIELANERGGQDNISVVLLRYKVPQQLRVATPTTVPSGAPTESTGGRHFLWVYTGLLCVVQTILIFLVWSLLQV